MPRLRAEIDVDAAVEIAVRPLDRDLDELAWRELWSRVPGASPFQSPAWLRPWAEIYAPGRAWLATAACAGELVGALPLFWWEATLWLAGTGPSDEGDALLVPGFESAAVPLLEAALVAIQRPVERIDLQQLPASSPLLTTAGLRGWRNRTELGDACPLLLLGGADGLAHVPRAMRDNLRYSQRRLAREGAHVEPVPLDEVEAAVAALERVHALRWQERAPSVVVADALLRRLLARAAPALARLGLLRMQRVRRAGETLGAICALRGDRRTCFYLSGFDPACARMGPGVAMIGAVIAQAAREGDIAVDFLRGQEPYKHDWGARDVRRWRRVFERAA